MTCEAEGTPLAGVSTLQRHYNATWSCPIERRELVACPAGERQARAWPRVVAVISWIVLVMVLCWYYVFPWLERVLPENF